jgi:hypothetical protein
MPYVQPEMRKEEIMKRNERGIALMTALFALLLLTGIGFGLLYMTDAETMVNSNYRSSQQAYFAAMAGLQNVRERLTIADAPPHKLTQAPFPVAGNPATPGNPSSILYVINAGATPTTPGSDYDTQLQAEYASLNLGWPPSYVAPSAQDDMGNQPGINVATFTPLPYRWVRVEQKLNGSNAPYMAGGNGTLATTPICWNGANELPLTVIGDPDCAHGPLGSSDPPSHTPVYLLTAFASVPTNPPTTRVLQMEVAQDPPLSTHGAVDSQDHVNLNGQLTVNGYDYCSCTCTTTGSGNNQTTTCVDRVTGTTIPTCDRSHYAIYSASTVQNPNNSETLIAGTTDPQTHLPDPVVQNQPWTWDVQELVQRFSTTPGAVNVTNAPYNWNCSGGGCGTQSNVTLGVPPTFPPSPAGSPSGPPNMQSQITIVPGDLQLTSNSSVGNGVLVVNGNLDIHGGLQFYGVIIVTGVISFTGGGSAGTNIYGAVIAGQQSYVDTTLGGSANINFDYCALPSGNTTQPPRSLALRDINF